MIVQKVKRFSRISRYIFYKETLVDVREQFWSFLGSFFGIGLIAFVQSRFFSSQDTVLLIGSFGASSVLLYGAIQSPMAQPRNFILGHLLSAFIGVTINKLFPGLLWLAAPLAVSVSIVLMQMSRSLHPPGGATALIAVIGSGKIKALGYWYLLSPVLIGVSILFAVALIFNNITAGRQYPTNKEFTGRAKRILKRGRRRLPV